ncbi:hypothetical protein FBUS_07179 [Fasciolopsis buskii]|uniref:Uncharacterized protein n=1 Tax=Fasciolopsis buskii TaxID=27845 RepID=A0A8E0VPV2_9TREM|nr:hypothetical protein FBUS_07179 [Fasciolopsis buski]
MAGNRAGKSDDPVQIWPPTNQECLTNEVIWDDSELVAHYDRVDAFVKKKLNALYNSQDAGTPTATPRGTQRPLDAMKPQRSLSSFPQKVTIRVIRVVSSIDIVTLCTATKQSVGETQITKNLPDSTTSTNLPKCRSRSLNRLNPTNQMVTPSIPMPPLSTPMEDLEPLLRTWYEAGYNLGREHALKVCLFT